VAGRRTVKLDAAGAVRVVLRNMGTSRAACTARAALDGAASILHPEWTCCRVTLQPGAEA
jgi:hypothetical protein